MMALNSQGPSRTAFVVAGVVLLHVIVIWAVGSTMAHRVSVPAREVVMAQIVSNPAAVPPQSLPATPTKSSRATPRAAATPALTLPDRAAEPTLAHPSGAVAAQVPSAMAPAAPVADTPVQAPAPPPVAVPASAAVACPGYDAVVADAGYPDEARRLELEHGNVTVEFTVTASGQLKDIVALSSSHRAFARAAVRAVRRFSCIGAGRDVTVTLPLTYRVSD